MLKELTCDDLYVRYAYDDNPDDADYVMHIHEQCEIYFFVAGNVEYLVEGSRYLLPKNSMMIMRPAEAHRARITGGAGYERYAINFSPERYSSIDPEGKLMQAFFDRPLGKDNLFTENEIDTSQILRLLKDIFSSKTEYNQMLALNTRLPLLLEMIYNSFSKRLITDYQPQSTEESMVYYVNSHLFENLSIPQLAEHFYLSPSQFSRRFKQATGSAPWDFIIRKRLTIAKEKIRQGIPSQKAAEACGFSDYSSFYRAYTKLYGQAPTSSK